MVTKSEAAKLVLQEDKRRELYGFPMLPPFYMPLKPPKGVCEGCKEKDHVRHGYCFACIRPDVINLLFS